MPLIIGYFRPDFQLLARSGREQRNENSETGGGDGLDGGWFVLRIVSDVPAGFGETSLGFAFSDTGIYASVFYNRVDEFANKGIATHSQILGHAMAHEIGHLLLD